MKTKIWFIALFAMFALGSMAPTDYGGLKYTPAIVLATNTVGSTGSVAAGKHHIEFILSSDYAGTIQGVAMSGWIGVYSPGEPPQGAALGAMTYTVTAGSLTITTW